METEGVGTEEEKRLTSRQLIHENNLKDEE
jgi:hypothetical protein